jgi:ABC-type multidrug transport system ATPase subunit
MFDKKTVLDRIDLMVREGEIFGITGLNGSGKTALLKIMATIIKPTGGKVEISGHDIVKDRDRIRPVIGYMPDSAGFENRLSVKEYLDFFLSMYKKNRGDHHASLSNLLSALDLKQMEHIRMSDLSAGMKQKISLVRSIMHDPSVLLLDGPECGMDWEGQESMTSILKDQSEKGKAVVVASRSISFLNNIAHRIGVLHDGELRWMFPAGVESRKSIMERINDLERGRNEPGPA